MGSFRNFQSGGPMNGSFPSQMSARMGQPSYKRPPRRKMIGQGSPQEAGGFAPPPQPAQAAPYTGPVFNSDGSPAGDPRSSERAVGYEPFTGGQSTMRAAPGIRKLGSSFWSGDTLSVPTSSEDYGRLRGGLEDFLLNRLNAGGGFDAQDPADPERVTLGPERNTMSLDQLGAGSQFFRNIQDQLNPVFNQRRELGLAQAKESAGNLTGSGFASALGKFIGRSQQEENAQLLDYATRHAMSEMQRQAQDADRAQQLGITQGTLDQNRNLNIFNTRSATNNANAGRFTGLLGQLGTAGVGSNEIAQTGGVGAALPGIAGLLGSGEGKGLLSGAGDIAGMVGKIPLGSGTVGGFVRNSLGKLVPAAALFGAGQLASPLVGRALGSTAASATRSAGTGAALGSIIPGVGTLVGGAVGAALPYAKKAASWLKKRLSDEELKTDIVSLGYGGLHSYRFKGSPDREIGFIAQDVKRVLPSAVSRHKSGYLQVDYSKAPSIINAMNGAR